MLTEQQIIEAGFELVRNPFDANRISYCYRRKTLSADDERGWALTIVIGPSGDVVASYIGGEFQRATKLLKSKQDLSSFLAAVDFLYFDHPSVDRWQQGYYCCLATLLRIEGDSTAMLELLAANRLTIKELQEAGVDQYDIDALNEHGLLSMAN